VVPVARVWQETIGGTSPGGERYLRLTPAQPATDGFFVAIFERQSCPTAS
jgi:16S rRNA C967 or C1407 C5-methylase (RsmB/RsmF family)